MSEITNKNKKFFEDGEANEWFRRNKEFLESSDNDSGIKLLVSWLQPFQNEISEIIEIGCGSGHRLNQLSKGINSTGFGVEPSKDAIKYIHNTFPELEVQAGFSDNIPFNGKFDLVHLGFFLYLVDREVFLKSISEVDRLVKFGGFLSIIDFETPYPYTNSYSHNDSVFSYKHNNCDVFVASGLYSIVNKFHFSSSNGFYFDKNIDERISITLLYKETDVMRVKT